MCNKKEGVYLPSASSQARPAPKPRPTQAGHALRLNKRTEKITPNDRPREERMIMEDMARSHYYFAVISDFAFGLYMFSDWARGLGNLVFGLGVIYVDMRILAGYVVVSR